MLWGLLGTTDAQSRVCKKAHWTIRGTMSSRPQYQGAPDAIVPLLLVAVLNWTARHEDSVHCVLYCKCTVLHF